MTFELLAAGIAFLAGAIASIAGFGIGSILTPLAALEAGTKTAIPLVSIPHLLATLLRYLMLRKSLDRRVFRSFGLSSAAGGLAGALLHAWASGPALTIVFGSVLVFAGITELAGGTARPGFGRRAALIAGAVSGTLGGIVGNQGGIRSAALLRFHLDRRAFVATATAVGLVVDAVRVPVYFLTTFQELRQHALLILLLTGGALLGTTFGGRLLRRLPEILFRRAVAATLTALGLVMLLQTYRIR